MPGIRFTDVLITANAIAAYLGKDTISPEYLGRALGILLNESSLEKLGPPVSPLVTHPSGGSTVGPALRELVQRWWVELGEEPLAELGEEQQKRLRIELESCPDDAEAGP